MLNFDFLLNIPLKCLGLMPILTRKSNYLNYASFIYSGVVMFFIIYGELDYIYKVYIKNVTSDIFNVEGVIKYTYLTRDLTGILCATVNLVGTQVFHVARINRESTFIEIDKVLKPKVKQLRNSVAFFVLFFILWILISLMNVVLMKPRSFSRILSLSVGTINAFTIIAFSDKLYIRFSEINLQLELLLDDCLEVNKIKEKSTESRDMLRLQELGKCHTELCQIVDKMREDYGISMIFVLLVIMMNTISFSIFFLVGGINGKNFEVFIRYTFWAILHVVLAYFLLYKGTQLSDEAYSIRNIIWNNMRLPLEPAIASEAQKPPKGSTWAVAFMASVWCLGGRSSQTYQGLEILILKTEHHKYRIDCGYFELSLDTFGPMANSILTQVVIIYTFQ